MNDSEFKLKVLRSLESIQGRLTRLEERLDDLNRMSSSNAGDLPHTPRSTPVQPCGCRWGQGTGRITCAQHAEDRNYPAIGEYDLTRDPPTAALEVG